MPSMRAEDSQSTQTTIAARDSTDGPKRTGTGGQLRKRPWRRYTTPWDDIVGKTYPGEGTEEKPYLVDWLEGDAENPMTWKQHYKWFVVIINAVATLAVSMASSTL